MTNARKFLDEIADILRAKGREVEVLENETEYGILVWMHSPRPNWYDKPITLSAYKSHRTNRWSLGPLAIDHKNKASTRSRIKVAAEVYA